MRRVGRGCPNINTGVSCVREPIREGMHAPAAKCFCSVRVRFGTARPIVARATTCGGGRRVVTVM